MARLRGLGVVLAFLVVVRGQTSWFVSPTGKDSNPGSKDQPFASLHRALQAVEESPKASPVTVNIEPGTFTLPEPLIFTSNSSGSPGSPVTWQKSPSSAGKVVISGGATVTGWAPVPGRTSVVAADVSHIAPQFNRHLFVNGARATRTRISNPASLKGAKLNEHGLSVSSSEPLSWPAGVEFVWPQSTSPWTEPRCAVDHVAKDGLKTQINMMQPCWTNLLHKPCSQNAKGAPNYIENVGLDHLSNPGDWWRNGTTAFYVLRAGETSDKLEAVIPTLESLIEGQGTVSARVQNIVFKELTFSYATWLRPGQADGYVEQQSGSCLVGSNPHNSDCSYDYLWMKSPGNIAFTAPKNVVFDTCEFSHLGGVGLDFGGGAHLNLVTNSYFWDISGAAMQIGAFDTFNITDAELQEIGNMVNNSVFNKAAAEFSGAVAVNVGYAANTTLTHCDISNLTYSGVSFGWGWSRHPQTYVRNNTIAYNRVYNYKQTLNDGGGIYMLGPQNGSVIHHNWVYQQHTASSGALYPDEGSAYTRWYNNLVTSIGSSQWLHLWTSSIHNVTVEDNWSDTSTYLNKGTNCPMINNTVFKGSMPAAAQAIADAAGVKNSHWALNN